MTDKELREQFQGINEQFRGINEQFRGINERFQGIDEQFRGINEQFRGINERFQGIDERFQGIDEQFRIIFDNMATKDDIQDLREELRGEIYASETRIAIKIEHEVSDKLRSLFDGYKGVLENQSLLGFADKTLTKRLDELEARVFALETR